MRYVERLRSNDKVDKSYIYRLDDTIEFAVNSSHDYSLNNEKVKEIIEQYKKMFSEKYEAKIHKIRHDLRKNDEYYEKLFETGIGNDYYHLVWSVKMLNAVIEKEKIKPVKLETAPLIPFVNQSGITKDGLHRAKDRSSPIIIAEIPFLNPQYLIVDGNHRLVYKSTSGERYIEGYLLKPEQHKKAMVNELFRYLFDFNAKIGSLLHRTL